MSGQGPVMSGNVVNDEDYFMITLYRRLPDNIRKRTYNQIQDLFNKYSYKYIFKREDVETLFNIKKSRSSEIIALLLDNNLIEIVDTGKYKFKK